MCNILNMLYVGLLVLWKQTNVYTLHTQQDHDCYKHYLHTSTLQARMYVYVCAYYLRMSVNILSSWLVLCNESILHTTNPHTIAQQCVNSTYTTEHYTSLLLQQDSNVSWGEISTPHTPQNITPVCYYNRTAMCLEEKYQLNIHHRTLQQFVFFTAQLQYNFLQQTRCWISETISDINVVSMIIFLELSVIRRQSALRWSFYLRYQDSVTELVSWNFGSFILASMLCDAAEDFIVNSLRLYTYALCTHNFINSKYK